MRRFQTAILTVVLVAFAAILPPAIAQYIPDKLFVSPYVSEGNPGSTLHITGSLVDPVGPTDFYGLTPIPNQFVIDESNIFGPSTGFSRNSHLALFTRAGETGGEFGHAFQRSEAWDISYDMKIETPNPTPRKEAGFFFQSPNGESMFIASSNAGHFTDGPGEIATVFPRVIPEYNFSSSGGLLGDYSSNQAIDAADYTIWRDTLGSDTDFHANGNNEGASEDFIDMADYDTWKAGFGKTAASGTTYTVGDTINMRMIYTPPETDPLIPFSQSNPGANVVTPGTMEYLVRINDGPILTSEPIDFPIWDEENPLKSWRGIPNGTFISVRVQNLSLANVAPDSSKVTFSNFDFDGPSPGAGTAVPEPGTIGLFAAGSFVAILYSWGRRRSAI
ncbi:MAG: PEP-CTERM sorting domain-containing protein [Pirellulales bacterium]